MLLMNKLQFLVFGLFLTFVAPTNAMQGPPQHSPIIGKKVTLEDVEAKFHSGRMKTYSSLDEYLASFEPGQVNHGHPKILIIGGGLAYDDLVIGNGPHFLTFDIKEQKRIKPYPNNAYLVDLDGRFVYYYGAPTDYNSYSDFKANISIKDGEHGGLPIHFKGQFDIVILESLAFEALNKNTFLNCWDCLKPGGMLICNNHISPEPYVNVSSTTDDLSANPLVENFTITDIHANKIVVFYPLAGIINNVSNKFYLFTPAHEVKLKEQVDKEMQVNNEYVGNVHKQIIAHARSEHFLGKLKEISSRVLPNLASLKLISDVSPNWYGVIDNSGYLVWHKKEQ